MPLHEAKEENRGAPTPDGAAKTIGDSLDHFFGTWSAEEEAELLKATEVFEQIDESFWKCVSPDLSFRA